MNESSIQEVRIYNLIFNHLPEGSWGKFIVAELSRGRNISLVVRAAYHQTNFIPWVDHYKVVDLLEQEVGSAYAIKVLGGGMIGHLLPAVIEIWGDSQEHGREPDRAKTIEMFWKEFRGFQIKTCAW